MQYEYKRIPRLAPGKKTCHKRSNAMVVKGVVYGFINELAMATAEIKINSKRIYCANEILRTFSSIHTFYPRKYRAVFKLENAA